MVAKAATSQIFTGDQDLLNAFDYTRSQHIGMQFVEVVEDMLFYFVILLSISIKSLQCVA